jgi:lysophospholipase L1-like esterase
MKTPLLMPIAVLQGLWVLRRTPKLPAPVGNSGRCGSGTGVPLRVVGVGDSIMAGTGVSEQRHSLTATYARRLHERLQRNVEWRVHGCNGATSATVLHKLAPAVPGAHVYLVSVGVNDATSGVDAHRFARNLHRSFTLLRRKAPRSIIIFGGLPPLDCFPALPWPLKAVLAARARELQLAAEAVAARHARAQCFQFPPSMPAKHFARDGFHPAEHACERWAAGLLDLWPTAAPAIATGNDEVSGFHVAFAGAARGTDAVCGPPRKDSRRSSESAWKPNTSTGRPRRTLRVARGDTGVPRRSTPSPPAASPTRS